MIMSKSWDIEKTRTRKYAKAKLSYLTSKQDKSNKSKNITQRDYSWQAIKFKGRGPTTVTKYGKAYH